MRVCQGHPNIVQCYGSYRRGDYCGIVMEYAG